MKLWLKGCCVGLFISVILGLLFISSLIFTSGESGMIAFVFYLPAYYLVLFSGIDYLIATISNADFSLLTFLVGTLITVIFGSFIGFILDKKISFKSKLVFFFILLIVFAPLSISSYLVKYNDKQILLENKWYGAGKDYPRSGRWYVTDRKVCNDLSVFEKSEKSHCFESQLYPMSIFDGWNVLKEEIEIKKCLNRNSKEYCISDFAFNHKDFKSCEAYLMESARSNCISRIASSISDASKCPKPKCSPEECNYLWYEYSNCIIEITGKTNNILLCENIGPVFYMYGQCKFNILTLTTDINNCYKLKNYENYDTKFKDDCIIQMAIRKNDINLCNLPEDTEKKQDCKQRF